MECMTRCAAVAISFPILNITHMHKHSWKRFSGIWPAWNAHFLIILWSDALICLPLFEETPKNIFPESSFRCLSSPLHLKCRVDGAYMASDWLCRSLSMFSRNRTRVTALQEQCNMADVGSQKCLHGNTPACALGLYGSRLDAARRLTLLRYKHREMFEQSSKFKGNCSLLSPWASMGACTEY